MDATQRLEVANTIRQQIGPMAAMMMGAKQWMALESGLQFNVGRGPKGVTRVLVKLAGDDTYTVECWKCRGVNATKLSTVDGVYVDALHRTIEEGTGLYLSF